MRIYYYIVLVLRSAAFSFRAHLATRTYTYGRLPYAPWYCRFCDVQQQAAAGGGILSS
jgi:hypothetical protein